MYNILITNSMYHGNPYDKGDKKVIFGDKMFNISNHNS